MPRRIPTWAPWRTPSPQKVGSLPDSATSSDVEVAAFAFSGPPDPSNHWPVQNMIQFNMIVTTTSCAPTVAFRKPAMPARSAPARPAAAMPRTTCGNWAMLAKDEPTQTAASEPAMYWPCPPMLKSPQRNANATARPVKINVVVRRRVCWSAYADREDGVDGDSSPFVLNGNHTWESVKGTPML